MKSILHKTRLRTILTHCRQIFTSPTCHLTKGVALILHTQKTLQPYETLAGSICEAAACGNMAYNCAQIYRSWHAQDTSTRGPSCGPQMKSKLLAKHNFSSSAFVERHKNPEHSFERNQNGLQGTTPQTELLAKQTTRKQNPHKRKQDTPNLGLTFLFSFTPSQEHTHLNFRLTSLASENILNLCGAWREGDSDDLLVESGSLRCQNAFLSFLWHFLWSILVIQTTSGKPFLWFIWFPFTTIENFPPRGNFRRQTPKFVNAFCAREIKYAEQQQQTVSVLAVSGLLGFPTCFNTSWLSNQGSTSPQHHMAAIVLVTQNDQQTSHGFLLACQEPLLHPNQPLVL